MTNRWRNGNDLNSVSDNSGMKIDKVISKAQLMKPAIDIRERSSGQQPVLHTSAALVRSVVLHKGIGHCLD